MLRLIGGMALAGAVSMSIAAPAFAQSGFGFGGGGVWKVVSGALQPITSTWTIGSASDRVDAIYTDLLDATNVVVSGVVPGTLSVGALTVATTTTLTAQYPNAVLFTDENKAVSSTSNFLFDGTTPSSGAGSMALGVGAATSATAILNIDGNNGTNIYGLRLLDQGAGTSGIRYDLAANGDLHIDSASDLFSGTDFRIGTTNRPLLMQVNSSAFNTGSPYAFAFQSSGLPSRVAFLFVGSSAQTQDIVNVYNNSASTTPVFAIGAQGATAIGSGASTSTVGVMLDVVGGGQFSTTVTSTNIKVVTAILPTVNEAANIGSASLRFGALFLDTPAATNAINVQAGSPYEFMCTGASGCDFQSSGSSFKIGTASTFSTQLYSNGAEANPQLRVEGDGRVTMRPGSASVISAEFNTTGTQLFGNGVTTTLLSATGLIENTGALAYVCVDANGNFFKDSSTTCLLSKDSLKDNLRALDGMGLETVMALQPREWEWKEGLARTGSDFGFSANQASTVDERLITREADGSIHGFRYEEYTAVLTRALQELNAKVEAQQREIVELHQQLKK